MKIALDLDGVLTKVGKPQFLPFWIMETVLFVFRWIFLFFPQNKELISFLRNISEKGNFSFVIISARPSFCQKVTEVWLMKARIPFKKVYCLGLRVSKNIILEKEEVCLFIDDELLHIKRAIAGGYDAIIMDDVF